jgi:hypothetical protein
MNYTVAGLVDKPVEAQAVIDDLTGLCLCDRSDISLIARDHPGQAALPVGDAVRATGQVAAAAGTAGAKSLGALLGLGSAIVSRKVSGFGVLSAVGQAGATLSKIALETAQDVGKALLDFGVDQHLARGYADAVGKGSILILVNAKTQKIADCARQVMRTRGAAAPDARSA